MRSFHRLYEEMQLGERADLTARIVSAIASATGAFRHRLPAHELTTAEFMKVFAPGHFESVHDFLQAHEMRPDPWKEIPPGMVSDDSMDTANRAVAQKFSFLGGTFDFRETVDWHHSLGPGGPWPRAHWSQIQFKDISHLGDIKPCWEMNRHQFFVSLALAWIRTKDARYPQTVKKFLHSWCDQNTPETGVNYISGLDMGLRCMSWIFTDKLLRGCSDWDEETRERMHRNIYSQAKHINEYLSFDGKLSGSYHLLGEASALIWIALHYPEWQESARWLDRGLDILWPALDAQVFPDGLHYELSFGYQLQVLEFMALVFTEMRRQKKPLPSKCYMIVEKMAGALPPAQQPDGELPNTNDNDNGAGIPLPLSTSHRVEGIMTVMSVLYDRPDFKSATTKTWSLYALLLLGDAGADEFRIIPEFPQKFPFVTENRSGGIYILRKFGDWLLLKNNRDPFPHSGHNHADLLSVLLYFDGRPVLVDAGTYHFLDDKGIRNALRGTSAHNTLTIDKQGQATPLRNFDWSRTVKPGFTQVHEEEDFALIDAQHDSYHGLQVTHRRVVLWFKSEDALMIIDQVQGAGAHAIDQYWHFPPGMRVEDTGGLAYRLSSGGQPVAYLRFLRSKERDHNEVLAGSESNPAFYYSPRYGAVEPGVAIRHSWTSTLSASHGTHRVALFSKKNPPVEFGDVWHAEFLFNGWTIDLTQTPAKVVRAKV